MFQSELLLPFTESPGRPLEDGKEPERSKRQRLLEVIDASLLLDPPLELTREASSTPVLVPEANLTTSEDNSSTYDPDTLITSCLETLARESTSTAERLQPFWKESSKELSLRLLLHTETDSPGSASTFWSDSSDTLGPISWYSTKTKRLTPDNQEVSWSPISWQSSVPIRQGSTGEEAIPIERSDGKVEGKVWLSKEHLSSMEEDMTKPSLKTMKFRLWPTKKQKEDLVLVTEQYRYYYNLAVEVARRNNYPADMAQGEFRKFVLSHDPPEIPGGAWLFWEDTPKTYFIPSFWKEVGVHSRIPRSAVRCLKGMMKSAQTNKARGHNHGFELSFKTKKGDQVVDFEDVSFPSWIRDIRSTFYYRKYHRHRKKRQSVSFKDVFNDSRTKRSACKIHWEKDTDRWYLYYSVEEDYYPPEDFRESRRNVESQDVPETTISLDPGVRKFLVGFTPETQSFDTICSEGKTKLIPLLQEIDQMQPGREKRLKWKRVKNLVDDLHWKSIRYLTKSYGSIILGDIGISSIMRGRRLHRMTKRVLQMFSFHKFKLRLQWKCQMVDRTFALVDESYTSKTCCRCGELANVGGSETFKCNLDDCGFGTDRDCNGAVNIYLKLLTLLHGEGQPHAHG